MQADPSILTLITLATVRGHKIEESRCTLCKLNIWAVSAEPACDCSGVSVCLKQNGTTDQKRKVYVYVAGPLTTGQLTRNVRDAAGYASVLFNKGYAVYLPHASVLWEIIHPATYEDWMQHDLLWVAKCDCVFRFPGASPGADREVAFAAERGIPVYLHLEHLYAAQPLGKEE